MKKCFIHELICYYVWKSWVVMKKITRITRTSHGLVVKILWESMCSWFLVFRNQQRSVNSHFMNHPTFLNCQQNIISARVVGFRSCHQCKNNYFTLQIVQYIIVCKWQFFNHVRFKIGLTFLGDLLKYFLRPK